MRLNLVRSILRIVKSIKINGSIISLRKHLFICIKNLYSQNAKMKDSPLCQFPCPIYNIFSQHDSDPEYSLFLFSALIYNGKKKIKTPTSPHSFSSLLHFPPKNQKNSTAIPYSILDFINCIYKPLPLSQNTTSQHLIDENRDQAQIETKSIKGTRRNRSSDLASWINGK